MTRDLVDIGGHEGDCGKGPFDGEPPSKDQPRNPLDNRGTRDVCPKGAEQPTSNPSDVLDRLRRARALLVELGITYPTNPSLYGEAADEIERLREELHPPSKPLLAHYEAVYKALNEFRPVTGTEDWVAVRLKALGLLLDNHPSKFRAADETPACPACGSPLWPGVSCGRCTADKSAASLNKESVIKSSADKS